MKESEFERIYHSKERRSWVVSLSCVNCWAVPSENAHTKNGGMGRKGHYSTIIPLCSRCHRTQHTKGWAALPMIRTRANAQMIANDIEKEWRNQWP